MATRVGFVYLNAEVEDPNEGIIPSFSSDYSTGRNRHDRADMHYGEQEASLIQTSLGQDLEATLRLLWDMVVALEANPHRFYLDAETDEDYFWRDKFTRVVADDLGRSTGVISRFGDFDWQRYSTADLGLSAEVLGGVARFDPHATEGEISYVGYPTFETGELWLEFINLSMSIGGEWMVEFQPWRADVTSSKVRFGMLRQGASTRIAYVRIDSTLLWSQSFISGEWTAFRLYLDGATGDVKAKAWRRGIEAEPDWEDEQTVTLAAPNGATPVMRVLFNEFVGASDWQLDNIRTRKTDTDAPRLYRVLSLDASVCWAFTLDANVLLRGTGSFTLDAIVRANVSASFTLDANVRGTEGAFTLDAIVKATRSQTFTLDAFVVLPESGLLGDHTLARHMLGGALPTDPIIVFEELLLNAWIKASPLETFSIDAYVGAPSETGLLADHTLAQNELGGG